MEDAPPLTERVQLTTPHTSVAEGEHYQFSTLSDREKKVYNRIDAAAEQGKTVVLVLHDLTMALECADSLAVLGEGTCLLQGSPEEVFLSGCLNRAFGVEVRRFRTPEGWKYYYGGKTD